MTSLSCFKVSPKLGHLIEPRNDITETSPIPGVLGNQPGRLDSLRCLLNEIVDQMHYVNH